MECDANNIYQKDEKKCNKNEQTLLEISKQIYLILRINEKREREN